MLTSLSLKQLIHEMLPCCYKRYTEGIWNVKKYADGTAECWGTWGGNLTHYATAGGFYGYTTSVNFPSGLFVARPTLTYNCAVGRHFSIAAANISVSSTTASLYALSNASGTQSVLFDMHVKGRWK